MSNNAIPHLSMNGWMKNYNQIMIKLYEYFLTSEYSQSNTYHGYIASLKYILQNNVGVDEIKSAIQKTLYDMYVRYYDTVDVIVTITEEDNNVSYRVNITAIIGDKTYRLDNTLETIDNNVTNMDVLLDNLHNN